MDWRTFSLSSGLLKMPNTYPFNKPAQHVIVDLLNQTLVKRFAYESVEVTSVETEFNGHHCLPLPALWPRYVCRERSSFSAIIEGYQNALQCNYHRLYLSRYLPHAIVVGDAQTASEAILEAIQNQYGVFLDSTEVEVLIYGLPVDEDVYRAIVRPVASHLVWAGDLEVLLVQSTHIALEISVRELGALKLEDDPDIVQLCDTLRLAGFIDDDLQAN